MRNTILFLLLILNLFLFSCNQNNTNIVDIPIDTKGNSSLQGTVRDSEGNPLIGAQITVNSKSTITDANGQYNLNELVQFENLKINYSKDGYIVIQKLAKTVDGQKLTLDATLTKIGKSTILTNSGGTIDFNSATISFQANSFVDSKGKIVNGPISINATYLDPLSKEFYNSFSGNLLRQNSDGLVFLAKSFGYVNIEIYSNNEKVFLDNDKYATISINIPSKLLSNSPDNLKMNYYDKILGKWVQEGIATKQNNKYIAIIKHFSDWDFDDYINFSFISGKVVDQFQKPLAYTTAFIENENYICQGGAYTDKNGRYTIIAPENMRGNIYAVNSGFQSLKNEITTSKNPDTLKVNDIIINLEVKIKNGWYKQISKSSLAAFSDVYFINENEGWTFDCDGWILYSTSDGGLNWDIKLDVFKKFSSQSYEFSFFSVYFFNNKLGFLGGNSVIRTSDSGESWNMNFISENFANNIKIFDSGIGYSIGECNYKTLDSGKTWQRLKLENNTLIPYMRGAAIFDENQLLIWGKDDFYRSINGGKTWEIYSTNNFGQFFYYDNTRFLDFNNGFYGTDKGVYKTIDAGASWKQVYLNKNNQIIRKIFFLNKFKGWIVGEKGLILYTNDGGETWEKQNSGTLVDLYGVCFVNENKGWIVGDGGIILSTNNGGLE